MKKFLLHIGANKTGTSAIQLMLASNAQALARSGWKYPALHLFQSAHHRIGYALMGADAGRAAPEGWHAELAAMTADPSFRYIFSSELLFRMVPPEKLAQIFPPNQTQVVLYLREHLGYMLSWYCQAIQERNLTASFRDYVSLFSQPYSGYLGRWAEIYGKENITIRIFGRDRLVDGDIRRDFLSLLDGVDPDAFSMETTLTNPSLSGNLLFFKKVLNNYLSLEESIDQTLIDEFGALTELDSTFAGHVPVEPADAAFVRRTFQRDIDRLALDFGVELPPTPREVHGNPSPDFGRLQEDFALIKRTGQETDKKYMHYVARMPGWEGIAS